MIVHFTEDTPDWSPETLHLSNLAGLVTAAERTGSPFRAIYMTCWTTLTGLDEPEALTYAHQIATLYPPVTALIPPF